MSGQDHTYDEPAAWLATYIDKHGEAQVYTTSVYQLAVENDQNANPAPLYLWPSQEFLENASRSAYQRGYLDGMAKARREQERGF